MTNKISKFNNGCQPTKMNKKKNIYIYLTFKTTLKEIKVPLRCCFFCFGKRNQPSLKWQHTSKTFLICPHIEDWSDSLNFTKNSKKRNAFSGLIFFLNRFWINVFNQLWTMSWWCPSPKVNYWKTFTMASLFFAGCALCWPNVLRINWES